MDREDNLVSELLAEIASVLGEFPRALERRALEIQASGRDPELAQKLLKGADAMRDSGNIYFNWARHYAALAEGNPEGAAEEDEADFGM